MPANKRVLGYPPSEIRCLILLSEMLRPITRRTLLATERAQEWRTSERILSIVARRSGRLLPQVLTAIHLFLRMRANALDFQCIESSRYKYVYQLFHNDPKEAAAYLGIDLAHAPPVDACRAVIVTGGIAKGDGAKVIELIAQNHGWLAALCLAAPSGSVNKGLRIAAITRASWLKTIVAPAQSFRYQPDFMVAPTRRSDQTNPRVAAWQTFDRTIEAVPATTVSFAACAFACTFSLAAGVDRHGVARVHRAA